MEYTVRCYELCAALSSVERTTWTTTTSTTTSKSVTGLLTGNLYECQVRATCGTSNGSYSASTTFTPTAATTCNTPTNLSSSSVTSSGAMVSWTAVSGASNYTVNVRVLGSSTWGSDISTASTSTALSGLTASTNYEFRVKTNCSTSSSSAYATAATFTTTAATTTSCGVPTGLAASSITGSGFTMTWNTVSGATSYTLRYRVSGATSWITSASSTTSKTISGLTPGASYDTQVKAICGTSNGSYSSTILVVMPATTQSFDEEYEGDTGGSSYGAEDNQCPDMDIAFDYTVSNGTVSFDDQSMIDYTAFLWNFGDGDFAETRHPTHHYAENGTYLFEVRVTDKSGCVGNFSGFVYITDDEPSDDMIDATQLKDFNR
ncbi:MAG: fibronectin type III domain-containing protein [Sphingobacteriales bacterium]|nr:fibronectin type III domain-containing protein [Sphingobacteriales bacterium]